jgi:hypothetical protein
MAFTFLSRQGLANALVLLPRLMKAKGRLVDLIAGRRAVVEHQKRRGAKTARLRWDRLDPVKALALQRRKEMPNLSRAEAIRRMADEVVLAAREAGEPLTGMDPARTIEDWFRKLGVK